MTKLIKKISIITLAVFAVMVFLSGALTFTPTKADAVAGSVITLETDTQVRFDSEATPLYDETGLTFFVKVNRTEINDLTSAGGTYSGYTASIGIALIPTEYLFDEVLTADAQHYKGKNVLHIPLINKTSQTYNDGMPNEFVEETYRATLVKIPDLEYETEISARAYVKFEKADAETAYVQTETIASKSIGGTAATRYASALADSAEALALKSMITEKVYPLIKNDLPVKTLLSFSKPTYVGLFQPEDKSVLSSYSVEYLAEYNERTDVIKISGQVIDGEEATINLSLPLPMTATKTSPQISNGETIKDANGQMVTFDITALQVDIYVAEYTGTTFGFKHTIVNNIDYGWGNNVFAPTLNEWYTKKAEVITGDNIRFGVTGTFEFYLSGIYQGSDTDREKALLAEKLTKTLRGAELANFDSQDYLALIETDQIYYGCEFEAEIDTFFGKENVLKLSGNAVTNRGGGIWINLPKAMTQTTTAGIVNNTNPNLQNVPKTTITLLMYVASYNESATFGLYNTYTTEYGNFGWNNLNFTPERNRWFYHTPADDVVTGDNIRIGIAANAGEFEIYIAAIYQGDTNAVNQTITEKLSSGLGENDLATFTDIEYLNLIESDRGLDIFETEVGTFFGKENVLKVRVRVADAPGEFKLRLIRAMTPDQPDGTSTQVSFQIYIKELPTGNTRFGVNHSGWVKEFKGNEFTLNEWQNHTFTVNASDYLRFYFWSTEYPQTVEFYISVISQGDASVLPPL